MKIGNLPESGIHAKLNKWYWGIEILKCPRTMIGVIRPQLFLCFVKFIDYGEPYKINGRKEVKKGGYKTFTSPYGLRIEISKYR